jgi:CubicO group peptidase (beta-lactamase class C family)
LWHPRKAPGVGCAGCGTAINRQAGTLDSPATAARHPPARQVVSSSWVQASLAEQSHVDNTGYGYFWWRPWLNVETPNGSQHVDMSAAQGNGGQKIYLLPQYDLIAVFTAGEYNSEGAPPNKIMANIILPALISARRRNAASSPLK